MSLDEARYLNSTVQMRAPLEMGSLLVIAQFDSPDIARTGYLGTEILNKVGVTTHTLLIESCDEAFSQSQATENNKASGTAIYQILTPIQVDNSTFGQFCKLSLIVSWNGIVKELESPKDPSSVILRVIFASRLSDPESFETTSNLNGELDQLLSFKSLLDHEKEWSEEGKFTGDIDAFLAGKQKITQKLKSMD